ncbi:MAG: hypothetical protein ACQEQC_07710 [Elusimicrobiota bacterium]
MTNILIIGLVVGLIFAFIWGYIIVGGSLEKKLQPLKDMLGGNIKKTIKAAKINGSWKSKKVIVNTVRTKYSNYVTVTVKHNFTLKCKIKNKKGEPVVHIPDNNSKIPLKEAKNSGDQIIKMFPKSTHDYIRQLFEMDIRSIDITETELTLYRGSNLPRGIRGLLYLFGHKNPQSILKPEKIKNILNLTIKLIEGIKI